MGYAIPDRCAWDRAWLPQIFIPRTNRLSSGSEFMHIYTQICQTPVIYFPRHLLNHGFYAFTHLPYELFVHH